MGEIQRGCALFKSKRTVPPMARKRMLSSVAVGRVQAQGLHAHRGVASGCDTLRQGLPEAARSDG